MRSSFIAPRQFTFSRFALLTCALVAGAVVFSPAVQAADPAPIFPPVIVEGIPHVIYETPRFIMPPATMSKDVKVAKAIPKIFFAYFPGQNYAGNPWSNWGDSLAVNGKYYASIGDHLAVNNVKDTANGTGSAFLYEFDPDKLSFRELTNTSKVLKLPAGHYTPGKIHSRIDMGSDGWLYFATHRGSTKVTTDQYHYAGDWIMRCDPKSGKTEVVAKGPVPKHCIPTSVLDPKRLIFYGSTAAGVGDDDEAGVHFFAYDVKQKKVLCDVANGPSRYLMFAPSTGRVYYVPGKGDMTGQLMRFDPATDKVPVKIDATIGLRAATQETPQGMIYTVSNGAGKNSAEIYSFNTKTEKVEKLGPAAVGESSYITSIDADPTGRYLYYIPGAHGGAERDGSPVIQFDTKTKQKKVIAFLHPFFQKNFNATPVGTFSSAIDEKGEKLYITWNVNRGGKSWDTCALTVIYIPKSERPE